VKGHSVRVPELGTGGLCGLHHPGEFFEFFLEVGQGESALFHAGRGTAGVVARDAVAMFREEGGEQFGGLEGVKAGLPELVAEGLQFVGGELLEVTHPFRMRCAGKLCGFFFGNPVRLLSVQE
jgi:hypothetical protein